MSLSKYQSVFLILSLVIFCKSLCEARLRLARCCSDKEPIIVVKNISGIYVKVCRKDERHRITDFSQVPVYTENLQLTNKTVMDCFNITDASEMNIDLNKTEDYSWLLAGRKKIYLTEEAKLYTDFPNRYERFLKFDSEEFCLGYRPTKTGLQARFFSKTDVAKPENKKSQLFAIFQIVAQVASAICLVLVLAVYGALKELRNLRGLILMSGVASLLATFLVLAVFNFLAMQALRPREFCTNFTLSVYFFTLSSFFWMNVMSFDIWWTFRGMVRLRGIHRRGQLFKYLVYCAYAWGVPLLMTVGVWLVDRADLTWMPAFIKPNIGISKCFFNEGERMLYLHVPMLILLLSNSLLFVWTVNNMGLAKTAGLNRNNASMQQNRFVLYLKLSAVMGISWLFEVVGSFLPPAATIVPDLYNCLIGVFIFFMFVYNGNTMNKLKRKYSCLDKLSTKNRQRHSEASDLTTSVRLSRQISEQSRCEESADPDGTRV